MCRWYARHQAPLDRNPLYLFDHIDDPADEDDEDEVTTPAQLPANTQMFVLLEFSSFCCCSYFRMLVKRKLRSLWLGCRSMLVLNCASTMSCTSRRTRGSRIAASS